MLILNGILSKKEIDVKSIIKKMHIQNAHLSLDFIPDISVENNFSVFLYQSDGFSVVAQSDRFFVSFIGNIFNKSDVELNNIKNDCEVILKLWEQNGTKTVEIIDGKYCFVVFDKQEKELYLVRDRMGQIPLYYVNNNNGFIFSTSIKSLVASSLLSKEISIDGLYDFLSYQTVQAPNTILKEVKMLPLASYLHIDKQHKVKITQYWNYQNIEKSNIYTKADVDSEIRRLFFNSVSQISEVGGVNSAFLSGGIDSSLVAGVLSDVSSNPINTFNIAFEESKYDESIYARFIADKINSNHTEYILLSADFLSYVPYAIGDMDHPSGDGINSWIISRIVNSKGINSVFSGVGGDELFGGYPIFKRMIDLQKILFFWKLPHSVRKLFAYSLKLIKRDVASFKISEIISQKQFNFNETYLLARNNFVGSSLRNLLTVDNIKNISLEWMNDIDFSKFENDRIISRVSISELSTYMQNILLRDSFQMSLPHGLSIYSPFLDRKLVEFLISLPDSYKFSKSPKQLLIDSFTEFLPDYIVNRPKMGFVLPWEVWLKHELKSFVEERINELANWDIFNKKVAVNLWTDYLNGKNSVTFSQIWPLVVLSQWKNDIENL